MSITSFTQTWLDTNLYPFDRNQIQLKSGKMNFVDEGDGDVILFVHGTPTWSFLYRDFIKSFSKTNRCIAIDHIGFGLSEKPLDFAGTPEAHSANLTEFINKLNLTNITLVVHDFGGPIGLGTAIQEPNKIKQIVLFNTWLWETKNSVSAKKVDKIINSRIGRFLYLTMNFSPKVLLKKGIYDKKKLSRIIHKHYINPFPNKNSREGLLKLGKSLVGSSNWYEAQWNKLDQITKKPWLILWGTKDEFIPADYLNKWIERLPNAEVNTFECGHFVQEEKTLESIQKIEGFINKSGL